MILVHVMKEDVKVASIKHFIERPPRLPRKTPIWANCDIIGQVKFKGDSPAEITIVATTSIMKPTTKNLKREMVRDRICGECAHGLINSYSCFNLVY